MASYLNKTKKIDYNFKLLIFSYGLSTFSEGIILPVYAFFVQNIGGGILETSGAISIFLIVSGLTTLIVQRVNWCQNNSIFLLILGWFLWLIGIGSYFIISNLFTLISAQILIAIGNAIADPAFDVELVLNSRKRSTFYRWGIFEASQDIFNGIASFLGGLIVVLKGFIFMISLMTFTATISFVLIVLYYFKIKRITKQKVNNSFFNSP